MTLLKTYIQPNDRHELHLMALAGGYISNTNKVPHRALSQYVQDLLNRPCQFTCDRAYLDMRSVPKSTRTLFNLELPNLMVKSIPTHFGLENWTQVLQNIAHRNIVPLNNDYPTLTDLVQGQVKANMEETIAYRLARAQVREAADPNIGQIYNLSTNVTKKQALSIYPLLEPTQYRDNRPKPELNTGRFSTNLVGPIQAWGYCWHMPHMVRTLKKIPITDDDKQRLLDIADYHHILPVRSRELEPRLAIVLEALVHNLLVPITTTDTDQPGDC
jgi:hypothetical protein